MKDPDTDAREAVALFRYGLIAELVNLPRGTPGIGAKLRAKANKSYVIPGTRRTRVAVETLRDWLSLYRQGGFEALAPKPRGDRGRARRLPPDIAEQLVAIKTEHPACSVRAVIQHARGRRGARGAAPAAVHRAPAAEPRGVARQTHRRPRG